MSHVHGSFTSFLFGFIRVLKNPFLKWIRPTRRKIKKNNSSVIRLITNYANRFIFSNFNFQKIIKKSVVWYRLCDIAVGIVTFNNNEMSKRFPWPIWNSISYPRMIAHSDRRYMDVTLPLFNAHLGQINIDFNFIQERKWSH